MYKAKALWPAIISRDKVRKCSTPPKEAKKSWQTGHCRDGIGITKSKSLSRYFFLDCSQRHISVRNIQILFLNLNKFAKTISILHKISAIQLSVQRHFNKLFRTVFEQPRSLSFRPSLSIVNQCLKNVIIVKS